MGFFPHSVLCKCSASTNTDWISQLIVTSFNLNMKQSPSIKIVSIFYKTLLPFLLKRSVLFLGIWIQNLQRNIALRKSILLVKIKEFVFRGFYALFTVITSLKISTLSRINRIRKFYMMCMSDRFCRNLYIFESP